MYNGARIRWIFGIMGAATVLAVTAFSSQASAQQSACGHRSQFVKMLGEKFAEAPASMGLAANGNVVEVFATTDGGSWTLLMTMPDGSSCLMVTGENWTSVTEISGQAS